MFQSPLHRGTLFNSITSDCRPIIYIVSVPSSSGHSLQQRIPRARNHEHDSFSPLFIGALSSTRNVPICLGGERRFSPLFIGALSSTPWRRVLNGEGGVFQSPLHRGTLFNPALAIGPAPGGLFQSPLHRGTLFNSPNCECAVPCQTF